MKICTGEWWGCSIYLPWNCVSKANMLYITLCTYRRRLCISLLPTCYWLPRFNVNKMMCVHLVVMKCAPTEFTIIMYLKSTRDTHTERESVCLLCVRLFEHASISDKRRWMKIHTSNPETSKGKWNQTSTTIE